MRKRFLSLAMIFVLSFAVSACGNYTLSDSESCPTARKGMNSGGPEEYNIADENAPPQNVEEDPFAGVQEDGDLGFLSHGEASPARADDQSVLPYEYNGGEFVLDYQFSSEGKLDSIGFLLFLDGKPQAYKVNLHAPGSECATAHESLAGAFGIPEYMPPSAADFQSNDTGAEYEYLHCFRTSEKHEEKFSFVFTPDTGKKGDTLDMTIVSVTRPDFQPDMKETSSYGWYHQSFERVLKLHFNEDAPKSDSIYGESITAFRDVSIAEKKVTSSFIENELVKAGWNGVTMDTLDDSVYWTLVYDGQVVYDNINLTGKDTLTVRYTLCGTPGARYGISFFLNHKPISFDGAVSCDVTLSKGNVWIIEATIDTAKLDGFNTFYATAVAADGNSVTSKTGSILLYKED